MINLSEIQRTLISELEKYCGCVFVPSNTTKNIPPYPYGSFSLLNTGIQKGTYCRDDTRSGKQYIPLDLTYSFTIQGEQEMEAMNIALKAHDFLDEIGRTILFDAGIVIENLTNITSRDTLLTIEFEYRKGFDAVVAVFSEIDSPEEDVIEKLKLEHEVITY